MGDTMEQRATYPDPKAKLTLLFGSFLETDSAWTVGYGLILVADLIFLEAAL